MRLLCDHSFFVPSHSLNIRILTIYLLPGKYQQWVAILDLSGSGHLNFNASKVGEADTVKYDA